MSETNFLSSNEAARRIGVKPHTLACWRVQGRGPAYHRLGGSPRGRVLYEAATVDQYVAARVFRSTSEETVAARGAAGR